MLALEDLADLGASLRGGGYRVSTQQLLAVQQLLLRLAADGALPAQRDELARWLAPVLCTSAAEQRAFAAQYGAWLQRRFGAAGTTEPPPPPPPPPPRAWRRWAMALAALVLLIVAGWWGVDLYVGRVIVDVMGGVAQGLAQAGSRPSTPASAPSAEAARLVLLTRVDLGATLPEPTFAERLQPARLALALAAPALFVAWLLRWWRRRPVLQRIASRTPAQLRDVHLPGAAAALLPGLPLRRLAQELRRRRLVDSTELQVEPTVQATLRRCGLFTPVRGAHAEPEYLALIDRAHGADHQARLAAEIVAALARSDVLIERWDFDRNASRLRHRSGRAAAPQGADLAELHERHPGHRVLVFGDASGCFDGFTGEPAPWTQTLASWPLAVLLTPLAPARWGRREWVLQRLGIHVLPLDAAGLVVLMGLAGGAGGPDRVAVSTELPPPATPRHDEVMPRRWLERDPPPPESVEQLVAGLRLELGPRGTAWLAACAAYPEVHWGITLRLGAALVPEPAEFERLLPRIVGLVWFRAAYLPDWWRERLLQELAPDDEVLARRTLRRLLEGVARGGAELPLRIALGAPRTDRPWWQRLQRRLRARGDAQRAQDLLRTAPPDSPLRDHVFLRFLSGASVRRLDLRAPAALLASLRSTRTAWPVALGGLALAAGAALAWVWPPVHRGEALRGIGAPQFSAGASSVAATSAVILGRDGSLDAQRLWSASTRLALPAAGSASAGADLARDTLPATGRWQSVAPDGTRVAVAGAGRVTIQRFGAPGAADAVVELEGAALPGDGIGTVDITFSPDGSRFALRDAGRIRVWDTADGRLLRTLDGKGQTAAADLEVSADGRWLASGSVGSGARVWNLETGALQLQANPPRTVQKLRFSPDSTQLAVEAGTLQDAAGRVVEAWSLPSAARLWSRPFEAANADLRYSPDGRWLVAWGRQRAPQLWRSADGAAGPTLAEPGTDWQDFAFSPDGTQLAGIDRTGSVRLWDTTSGAALSSVAGTQASACCIGGIAFAPDGRWLAAAAGTELALWALPAPGAAARTGLAYALVVGNNYPRSTAPLQGAVRDARAAAAVLQERYGFRVQLLVDPTRDALLAAYDKLAAEVQAEDRLLVFLSGHGLNSDRTSSAYLATPPTRELDAERDGVTGDTLAQRLAALRAGEALLIVDASGGFDIASGNAGQVVPARAVRSMISSYTSGEPLDAPSGSPFGRALEAALRAAGPGLTDRALLDDVARRMAQDRTAQGQRPALRRLAGAGDNGGLFSFPAPLDAAASAPAAAASSPDALRKSLGDGLRRIGAVCQRALAGRYPLERRSEKDTRPEDFALLFAPDGQMDRFFREQLAPFVDTSSNPWRWRPAADGRVLTGDPAVLRQFQRAAVIRDTFFARRSAAPSLRMRLTPVEMDAGIEMLTLNSNGQLLRFVALKPATVTLEWPGPRGTGPVMLQAEPIKDKSAGLRTDGPWALYRLFDRAEIVAGNAPERVRAQFTLEGRRAVLELNFDGVRNPLRLAELSEFRCPMGL